MWAICIHHISSLSAPGLVGWNRRSTFPSKRTPSRIFWLYGPKLAIANQLSIHTVNREIFVYENIHVLNIRVNKFSRVPHENILT